jgi:hypothetical protein
MLVAGTVTFRVFAADIVTVVNPDKENALAPILVTELGIVIDVNPERAWNALFPILEYPSIITIFAAPRPALTID